MQTSLSAEEIDSISQKLVPPLTQSRNSLSLKQQNEELQAKFNRLLEQSRNTIGQLMKQSKVREEALAAKAAEEIKGLIRYKEIVMKMQRQAMQGAKLPKQE